MNQYYALGIDLSSLIVAQSLLLLPALLKCFQNPLPTTLGFYILITQQACSVHSSCYLEYAATAVSKCHRYLTKEGWSFLPQLHELAHTLPFRWTTSRVGSWDTKEITRTTDLRTSAVYASDQLPRFVRVTGWTEGFTKESSASPQNNKGSFRPPIKAGIRSCFSVSILSPMKRWDHLKKSTNSKSSARLHVGLCSEMQSSTSSLEESPNSEQPVQHSGR